MLDTIEVQYLLPFLLNRIIVTVQMSDFIFNMNSQSLIRSSGFILVFVCVCVCGGGGQFHHSITLSVGVFE
jgi:hypothetical protein